MSFKLSTTLAAAALVIPTALATPSFAAAGQSNKNCQNLGQGFTFCQPGSTLPKRLTQLPGWTLVR